MEIPETKEAASRNLYFPLLVNQTQNPRAQGKAACELKLGILPAQVKVSYTPAEKTVKTASHKCHLTLNYIQQKLQQNVFI